MNRGDSGEDAGLLVDNVTFVSAVVAPAPATLVLLTIAVAGLVAGHAWRRR